MSGFKKTGIFPLDKDAIQIPSLDDQSSTIEDELERERERERESESEREREREEPTTSEDDRSTSIFTPSAHSTIPDITFTEEQIAQFQLRYDNGYDLYIDQDYVTWLQLHHPDSLPVELSAAGKNAESTFSESQEGTSSYALVNQSSPIRGHEGTILTVSESPLSEIQQQSMTQETPKPDEDTAISSDTSSSKPSTSLSESFSKTRETFSAITEFLTFPAVTSKKSKGKGKSPGGARVLTSDESLSLLLEKEKKKREEEEAKQQRKLEREEKRAAKEAEKNKKAEERERKPLERKKKAAELEEKRKERQLAKQNKSKTGTKTGGDECGLQNRECTSNECTVCFGNYDDDFIDGTLQREWVQCTDSNCQKWMHENCATLEESLLMCSVCGAEFK